MSDKTLVRRTSLGIIFDGVDMSNTINHYITSMTYTDCEEGESDDLQLDLQDREGTWLTKWLEKAVYKASTKKAVKKMKSTGLIISATIKAQNWADNGKDASLKCGKFEIDAVSASGPPSTVSIKATSLSYSSAVRQTKKSKSWENYHLSGIAKEIAQKNKMRCFFESKSDPHYKKMEQSKTSDIAFLSKLCKDAGISLKTTSQGIVLFNKEQYEAKSPVMTIKPSSKNLLKWKLDNGQTNTQYSSCRVRHTTKKGTLICGIAYIDDYDKDASSNQQLELYANVSTISEAKALAANQLRLHNQHECTVSFTMTGNPKLVAGITVTLSGWGLWDGKYIISKAKHTVSSRGYTTTIQLRKVISKKV